MPKDTLALKFELEKRGIKYNLIDALLKDNENLQ
ncbi:MAG: hypothetical protein HOA28_03460 [Euryarchaeota archaeon]|nr:hypothetical protein [Euryarchaeota archaeon]